MEEKGCEQMDKCDWQGLFSEMLQREAFFINVL
jgi:hypothetical protein